MDTSAPSLILIVDDETKIRRIVAANLERAGYDVISAADGMHALEIFGMSSPKPRSDFDGRDDARDGRL